MSKKLICLFLSLILLLSICLSGCSDKSLDEAVADKVEEASQTAVTLSMFLMSEEEVSAETAKMIEDALNEITESKYTVHMQLQFYTPDEYYDELDAAFAARAQAAKDGTLKEDAEAGRSTEKSDVSEHEKVQIVYPTIADYQVDLFYLGGQERFEKYLADGMFTKIDDQLESSIADKQFDFMPQHYFDYMKSINGGKSFAVSNAKAIGEYTYLLLNKDAMAAAYRYTPNGTTSFENYTGLTCEEVQDFLAYVSDANSGLSDTYYPLYTNLDRRELLFNNVQFFGCDENGKTTDAFSVLGGYLKKATMDDELNYTNLYAELTNLMADETFLSEMETLVKYEEAGYYSTNEKSGKEFAVGYVTGGAELALEYGDDYIMLPVGLPMLTEAEAYEDMFAVSSYTSDSSKAMQIMNLINTDEDVRNLLLYGIEGEHYQLVDSELKDESGEYYKLVERLNDDYVMSAARTGNTLITLPEKVDADENQAPVIPNIKEYIVQQNLQAAVNLSSGFHPTYKASEGKIVVSLEELGKIRDLSEKIWAEYLKCDTVAEFAAFKTWAADQIGEEEQALIDKHIGYVTEDGKPAHLENGECVKCNGLLRCETQSLACVYNHWLKEMDMAR